MECLGCGRLYARQEGQYGFCPAPACRLRSEGFQIACRRFGECDVLIEMALSRVARRMGIERPILKGAANGA